MGGKSRTMKSLECGSVTQTSPWPGHVRLPTGRCPRITVCDSLQSDHVDTPSRTLRVSSKAERYHTYMSERRSHTYRTQSAVIQHAVHSSRLGIPLCWLLLPRPLPTLHRLTLCVHNQHTKQVHIVSHAPLWCPRGPRCSPLRGLCLR